MASAGVALGAVPTDFTVQAVLRDGTGMLQSMPVSVTANLFTAQTAGTLVAGPYSFSNLPVANGLFSLTISDVAIVSKVIGGGSVWLEIQVGTDTYPRQKVTSQVFALVCGQADNALMLGGVAAGSYLTTTSTLDGTKLAPASVGAAAITPGTITATQVAPAMGVYSSRTGTYLNDSTQIYNTVGKHVLSACCNNANDLPVSGGCYTLNGMESVTLLWSYPISWETPNITACWNCNFYQTNTTSSQVTARVVCYPHP